MTNVSKDAFRWGHFGVILYHLLTACITLVLIWKNKGSSFTIVKGLMFLLILISLLALVPVFKKYDDGEIKITGLD